MSENSLFIIPKKETHYLVDQKTAIALMDADITRNRNWERWMEDFESGDIKIVGVVTRTDESAEFMLGTNMFTWVCIPSVMFQSKTKDDFCAQDLSILI